MRRFYLSHPYGGKPENREKAEAYANLYRELWDAEGHEDWVIVNPLEYFKEFVGVVDEDTILRMATNLMLTCDGVIWAPGWKRSRGCRYEHYRSGRRAQKSWEIPEEVKVA